MTEFIKIGIASEVALGHVKVYEAGGKRIAVCNVGGDFKAVADLCTHDGGPLGEGELVDHQIECPRHGARFDVDTGKAVCLPAVLPIATYKIEERNGELWVALPANVTR
jgi:3-phenylpropionate/trans-cinnamate dioxygenase ferredoxin component